MRIAHNRHIQKSIKEHSLFLTSVVCSEYGSEHVPDGIPG